MARLSSVLTMAILALGVVASPLGQPGAVGGLEARQATCGAVTCPAGKVCCNSSCGTCVNPGESCTQQFCEPTPCGPTSCAGGLTCCNSSCGYCTAPGEGCTKEFCLEPSKE